MGGFRDEEWEWNLSWRQTLFDNEIPMVTNFLRDIDSRTIQLNRRDEWVWLADNTGQYTTQNAYNLMRGIEVDGIQDEAFEEMWKLKVPSKYAVFAWRLLRNRLPSKINLHRRQIEVVDRSCPFCRNMEEDAGHLFFHCRKIIPIW